MHVGNVELDLWAVEDLERVENGHGRKGVAGRIEDDPGRLLAGRMDGLDDLAFEVGLAEVYGQTKFPGVVVAPRTNVVQLGRAIDLRLPLAKKIEIRPIEDEDGSHH